MVTNKENEVRSLWWSRLVGHLLWFGIVMLCKTLRFRIRFANPQAEKDLGDKQFIVALWHNRTLVPCYIYTHLMKSQRKMCMITSASKDGAMLTAVAEDFGMTTVRGSSHRRGARAFMEAVRAMKAGYCMCMAPDGPKGPMYKSKPGAIRLASVTGVPIIPAALSFKNCWRIKSWDRYIVPKPFSVVELQWGDFMCIPRDATPEQLDEYTERLNFSLSSGTPDFEDQSSDYDNSQIK